ncbi:MAG: M56 family metallopeptidase [Saprospiraceae bacterium]
MVLYLIKSGLCLAMVLGSYHLFFENKKMHQFIRWFLLFGLGFSFLVPFLETGFFVDFSSLISSPFLDYNNTLTEEGVLNFSTEIIHQEDNTSKIPYAYYFSISTYLFISSIFLIRFLTNITMLFKKAISNKQVRYKGSTLVLLKQKESPHTFGKYIFLNEADYQNQKIETAIFTHELTHAKQWHSLDIILLEALQIIFWFNPILIPYKRAIQLNHEFLADDQVIKSHRRVREYQELLLDKATLNKVYLASNLNFSVTKKRLKMMTKSTSHRTRILFASASIPIFICLLMLFSCNETNAQQTEEQNTEQQQTQKEEFFKNTTIVRTNKGGQKIYKPYADLSTKEKAAIPPPPPIPFGGELEPLPKGTVIELESDGRVLLDKNGDLLVPPPPPPAQAPHPPKAISPNQGIAPAPPSPPEAHVPNSPAPPPNPIEYIKELVAKDGNATFYLNEKEITGKKAMELLKKSSDNYDGITVQKGDGDAVKIYFVKKDKQVKS